MRENFDKNVDFYPSSVSLGADSFPQGKLFWNEDVSYAFKASLVGALRKHAGGMFLASDRSGYAARRELGGAYLDLLGTKLAWGLKNGTVKTVPYDAVRRGRRPLQWHRP